MYIEPKFLDFVLDNPLTLSGNRPVVGDPRVYKYAPQSALALGKGFNPADVTDIKPHFMTFTPAKLDAGSGVRKVSAYYVTSFFEFIAALQSDSKASASYLGAQAGVETSIGVSAEHSETSVTIVLNGTADYGRWSVGTDYKLRSDAEAVSTSDPVSFLQRYGTRFVESERRGSCINVILRIESASTKLKTSLKSSANAGADYGPIGGGSASTNLSIELAAAAKQGRLTVSVHAVGADVAGLQNSITSLAKESSDPLNAMTGAIAGMLAALNPDTGVPIEYYVVDMGAIGVDPNRVDLWTDYRESILRRIVTSYRTLQYEMDIANEILNPQSEKGIIVRHNAIGIDILIDSITRSMANAARFMAILAEEHKRCKEGGRLNEGLLDIRPSIVPSYIIDMLTSPPSIQYWIYGFNDSQVRQVLLAPHNQRLDVAKTIDPNINGIAITVGIRGAGISSVAERYYYTDGTVQTSDFVANNGGSAGLFYHSPPCPLETAQDALLAWATKHKGSYDVTICKVVRDVARREFEVPWLNLVFEADTATLKRIDLTVLL